MNANNVKIPERFIAVTENYGLVPDDTCFVLWRKDTVDPRKAPGYKGDMSAAVVYEKWRDQKRYYPHTPTGLRSALNEIAIKSVTDNASVTNIQRLIGEISAVISRIEKLIPEVSV